MKVANFSILVFLFLCTSVLAQQQLNEEIETMLLEEEESTEGLAFKPVISGGLGSFSFFGDVNDYMGTPLDGLTSYRISISRNISKNFDIEFHGTFGEVGANEYNGDFDKKLNFRTSLFLGGVSMYYNFNHILKRQRPIHPYISIGAEILQFTPKGDLLDAENNPYYYWTDGTIHSVEQGINSGGSLMVRDYKFESDLRDLDLYGYGVYSKTSFAIPIDLGVNITISDRVKTRLGATFHLAMTDYIDNLAGGSGYKNDLILNTYVAITFDLFSPSDELNAVANFRSLKFTITDREDADGDGVDDFNDECQGTPSDVKVDFKGCPIDTDNDGVPDYLDKENNTPSGIIAVGANGIRLAEAQLIVLLYDPDAVKRSEVKLYKKTDTSSGNSTSKEIPAKFKPVDVDGDNYISHEELQNAIDAIFEGTSSLTPGDIYELQDFFFSQ